MFPEIHPKNSIRDVFYIFNFNNAKQQCAIYKKEKEEIHTKTMPLVIGPIGFDTISQTSQKQTQIYIDLPNKYN